MEIVKIIILSIAVAALIETIDYSIDTLNNTQDACV